MPKPWEPGAVVLCDVRRDGSVWVRNEDLNKCLDRVAELEAALGNFVGWFDRIYPGGTVGAPVPGVTLWGIAEDARKALETKGKENDG